MHSENAKFMTESKCDLITPQCNLVLDEGGPWRYTHRYQLPPHPATPCANTSHVVFVNEYLIQDTNHNAFVLLKLLKRV